MDALTVMAERIVQLEKYCAQLTDRLAVIEQRTARPPEVILAEVRALCEETQFDEVIALGDDIIQIIDGPKPSHDIPLTILKHIKKAR